MNLLVVLFSNFEIRLLAGRCFLCVSKVALALFSGDLFLHQSLGLVLVLTMIEIDPTMPLLAGLLRWQYPWSSAANGLWCGVLELLYRF